MDKRKFNEIALQHKRHDLVLKNSALAFGCGAVLGVLGQLEYDLFFEILGYSKQKSGTLVSISFILIAALLTIIGWYKKLGQIFGAGLFLPITGFANSMVSAGMENRFEGPIYGIGSKSFSLAGSIIIYGVVASFIYGLFAYILMLLGVNFS